MSVEEKKAFIHRYFDRINGKDELATGIDKYTTDESLKQRIMFAKAAFSDLRFNAEDIIAEGDQIVVRLTISGTHTGDFLGVPPTGKQMEVPAIAIYRIVDNKIVEHWLQMDMLGILQQLGAGPIGN